MQTFALSLYNDFDDPARVPFGQRFKRYDSLATVRHYLNHEFRILPLQGTCNSLHGAQA